MAIFKKIGISLLIIGISLFIIRFFYPVIFQILGTIFYKIFNDWIVWIYIGLIIYFVGGGYIYGSGYSFIKRNYLRGTIICLSGALIILSSLFFFTLYTILTIIFTSLLIVEIKLILFFTLIFAVTPILLLTLEKWFDVSTFLKDIWRQRKEYPKLTYIVEEKGKLTYIHIQKNNANVSQFFEPAVLLKIQDIFHKIKKNPDVSLAPLIKSGFLTFITEIVRNFTSWPRTRNRIYRRIAKVKIGKNVCISQWTRLDPIFPDLIEFEEGSGAGIGCQLLTHNFMNKDPLTIYIGPIKIEKNARIGAFSTILPGVTIGEGSIIGAGSVVTDDIPPYSIAYGVPAQCVTNINEKIDLNSIEEKDFLNENENNRNLKNPKIKSDIEKDTE